MKNYIIVSRICFDPSVLLCYCEINKRRETKEKVIFFVERVELLDSYSYYKKDFYCSKSNKGGSRAVCSLDVSFTVNFHSCFHVFHHLSVISKMMSVCQKYFHHSSFFHTSEFFHYFRVACG